MRAEPYPWAAFGMLSCLAGVALVLSFPPPPPALPLAAGMTILVAVVAAGLWLARAGGLQGSVTAKRRTGVSTTREVAAALAIGAVAGTALGAATLLWLRLVPGNAVIRSRFLSESAMPVWKRWIVAFDAAVLEEILFRLLLVSLFVWILSRGGLPSRSWTGSRRAWLSIGVVAIGFGLAHLPKWLAVAPASAGLVASVLALNGIGGVLLGVLYWRRGIESALVGHFAADVVLHVLGPTLSWG
jgi:hypothetical protein